MGPATDLGPNQWVYLNMYGFESGAQLSVSICTDTAALPSPPLCVTNATTSLAIANYKVQAFSDGSTSISYQVVELGASDPALQGAEPGNGANAGTFRCNDASPCSIDVIDTGPDGQGSQIPTTSNTAVVPFTFAPSTNGCPSATTVNTESEFGIDVALPVQARLSCASSQPTFAFNTAIDGLSALTDLSNGQTEVAFTDDPESVSQQQIITAGHYALIPVALSANVIAFRSQMLANQVLYPQAQLELTPAMVAGLITTAFQNPGNADMVSCGGGCPEPPCQPPLKGEKPLCSLFTELNYVPGFISPQSYGGFVRSDDAGTTDQLFNWVCHAGILPVTALGQTWTETKTAATVLEKGLSPLGVPLTTCPNSDQFPPVQSGATAYTAYSNPSQQSLKMTAYVGPGLAGEAFGLAAFGTMNWADARYYGLSIASLQNSSGNFELPTPSSVTAALTGSSANADGSLQLAPTDPGAYPMTTVVYAAVPTTAYTAAQAAAVQQYLIQLLDLTGGSQSAHLPSGFVPLPTSLYQQALADVSSDVHSATSVPSGGSGGSTPPASAPSSPTASSGTSPTPTVVSPGPNSGTSKIGYVIAPYKSQNSPKVLRTTPITVASGGNSTSGSSSQPKSRFAGTSLLLSASSSRVLVPGLLLLGLLTLILGTFLLLFPDLRVSLALYARDMRRLLGRLGHSATGFVKEIFTTRSVKPW